MFRLHNPVLVPLDISIDPNSNGLPGIAQLRNIVGASMTVGLVLAVLALIISAIVWALGGALVVYAMIALVALLVVGAPTLADSRAPLAEVATAGGWMWAAPVVSVGAALAALGALLALLAGIGRTSLAMARTGDLPRWFALVHPRFAVPQRAELLLGAVVCALVLVTDLRGAIGFSSFGVLLYYLVANLAALTQDREHRRFPRALAVLGATGCVVLAATLPPVSVVGGLLVIAVGAAVRLIALRVTRRAAR